MEVRKLTENEHFEADLISCVAFYMRMEDREKAMEESKFYEHHFKEKSYETKMAFRNRGVGVYLPGSSH